MIPILLVFACSDQKLGTFNSPPSAQIISHNDGEAVFEDSSFTIIGAISDPNHNTNQLLATWMIENQPQCSNVSPNEDGQVSCDLTLIASDSKVQLQVEDPVGAIGTAQIELRVIQTQAPVAEIIEPLSTRNYYSDRLILFEARIEDAESDVTDLASYWESSLDGILTLDTTPDSSGLISSYGYLSEGEHAISLMVEDESGKTTKESRVISVGPPNSPPLCEITTPEETSMEGDVFLFEGNTSDPDIPSHQLQISWHSDLDGLLGNNPPTSNGEIILSSGSLTPGTHLITLIVEDELGESCSDLVVHHRTSLNTAPQLSAVTLSPTIVYSDTIVTCTPTASDPDGDALDYTYNWSNLSSGVSIGSNASLSLSAALVSPFDQIECTVIASDTYGDSDSMSVSTSVQNSNPEINTLSITPPNPQVGDTVMCNANISDIDQDTLSSQYEWRNGSNGSYLGNTDTLTLQQGQITRGELLTCTLTVEDLYGGIDTESVSQTIDNSKPEINSVSISPSTIQTESEIIASAISTDLDGDSVSYDYTWYVNSTVVQNSSSNTLSDTSLFVRGDEITVDVVPFDSQEWGNSYEHGPVTVENTPPQTPTISIDPQEPITEFDDLQCIVDVESVDADGDSVSYTIAWEKNGVAFTGSLTSTDLTDDTVAYDQTLNNETWTCTVTPDDGYEVGNDTSDSVTTIACADYRDLNSPHTYGTLTDNRNNKTYRTIQVGNDTWMADNLNYGNMITSGNYAAQNGSIEKHCLDDNPALCDEFGGFYGRGEAFNWVNHTQAEGTRGICPSGWHIPTYTEFETLFSYVSANSELIDICEPGGIATDLVGFSAKLAGFQSWGSFSGTETNAAFWTSTWSHADYSYNIKLSNDHASPITSIETGANPWANTLSIRCVMD